MEGTEDLVGGGGWALWTPTGQEWSPPFPVCGGTQENAFGAKSKKASQHTTPLLSVYWKVGNSLGRAWL